ncbi:FeoA family protein [Corynebacterium sp.]|uniref:FeoA family protein n=1 Tax=Corynebacterium sp. TaxID=1720 RepID=UPI0026DA9911|nr:FeoA family protein [Corynebacterium sp.]MDO5031216.1 FeoA family protein [Corynebacterium sp.]
MTLSCPRSTADTLPPGCTVTLGQECVSCTCDAALALRLGELGIRPGATLTMGQRVAGGARIVSVGACRYAIDQRTLRAIEV